jgi:hypothetical protein
MAPAISSLKSLKNFYAPIADIAQYDNHVDNDLEPCNCKECVMHALRFGGAYVVKKSDGDWAIKTTDAVNEKVKAISGRAIYSILTTRGEKDLFTTMIRDQIRAFPHDVSKVDIIVFVDKKRKGRDDTNAAPKAANTAMPASAMMPQPTAEQAAQAVAEASARAVAEAPGVIQQVVVRTTNDDDEESGDESDVEDEVADA